MKKEDRKIMTDKAACKDAYEGELRYELKKLPGGEVKWVKKKEK